MFAVLLLSVCAIVASLKCLNESSLFSNIKARPLDSYFLNSNFNAFFFFITM